MTVRSFSETSRFLKGPGAFRLFLALIVVFHHATKYIKLGEFAVYTFFMLSGYWIFKMYNEKYSLMNRPYFSFIAARWFRIYPTYLVNFLILILFVFIFKWSPGYLQSYETINHVQFWGSSLLLLSYNQLPQPSMFLVPAWSLDIELQFYLFFPIVFLCMRHFSPKRVCLLLLGIEIVLSVVYYDVFKNSFLPAIHFFMIGMLLCITDFKPSKPLLAISFFLFLSLLGLNYLHPVLRANMFKSNRDLIWMGMNYHWLFSTVLTFSIIPIVAFNVQQKSSKRDRFFGNVSYDIYLFHWVLLIPYNYFFAQLPFVQRLPFFLLFLCLTIAGGVLLNKFIDRPIEDFRSRRLKAAHSKPKPSKVLQIDDAETLEKPINAAV
jgi:peptidoglycan/LPS O-acetylase OafA/YrhL